MLELVKLVNALSNTKFVVDIECVYAQCTECGEVFGEHLCEETMLSAAESLMEHQEVH